MDDIDVPALGPVVFRGDMGKLRCHPEGSARIVPVILFGGHGHAAFSDAQIQQLVDIRLVFQKDILSGHADVGGAPLHIDGHIRGLDPEVAHPGSLIFKNQLPVIFVDGRAGEARLLKDTQNLFPQTPLGQSDVQHFHLSYRPSSW